jgi:ABC-2 type transport system permease protein
MKMIKTLIGIRLRSALSGILGGRQKNGKKNSGRGKIIAFIIAYVYLIAVFGGLFSFYATAAAPVLIAAKLDWFYFAMFTVIAFAMTFVLSIFETKGELFECKDNELLLAMPIKPRDIVLSRIFTVLIYNYLETLLVMLPAIICYVVFGGSAMGIIGSVILTLTLPIFSTALASGLGYAVALLSKKFKKNSL